MDFGEMVLPRQLPDVAQRMRETHLRVQHEAFAVVPLQREGEKAAVAQGAGGGGEDAASRMVPCSRLMSANMRATSSQRARLE